MSVLAPHWGQTRVVVWSPQARKKRPTVPKLPQQLGQGAESADGSMLCHRLSSDDSLGRPAVQSQVPGRVKAAPRPKVEESHEQRGLSKKASKGTDKEHGKSQRCR